MNRLTTSLSIAAVLSVSALPTYAAQGDLLTSMTNGVVDNLQQVSSEFAKQLAKDIEHAVQNGLQAISPAQGEQSAASTESDQEK